MDIHYKRLPVAEHYSILSAGNNHVFVGACWFLQMSGWLSGGPGLNHLATLLQLIRHFVWYIAILKFFCAFNVKTAYCIYSFWTYNFLHISYWNLYMYFLHLPLRFPQFGGCIVMKNSLLYGPPDFIPQCSLISAVLYILMEGWTYRIVLLLIIRLKDFQASLSRSLFISFSPHDTKWC